jgi:hypothetical protein
VAIVGGVLACYFCKCCCFAEATSVTIVQQVPGASVDAPVKEGGEIEMQENAV